MARPLRPDLPDSWYHVMNRGADRQDIFGHELDYLRFEQLLEDATMDAGLRLHAYCLMTNHFHLLVHCPQGGLSDAMQAIQRQYTQWYNARYRRDGPLYRGRFHSVDVTTDEQLTTVGRYIHRNPIALMPAPALSAYRWSSFGVYAGRRPRTAWLTVDRLAGGFANDSSAYRRFVETEIASDLPGQRAGGSRDLTLDEVVSAVTTVSCVAARSVRESTRGSRNLERLVAASLAVELRAASASTLAAYFGLASEASMRSLARRGRVAIAAQPDAASLRRRVLDELFGAELQQSA